MNGHLLLLDSLPVLHTTSKRKSIPAKSPSLGRSLRHFRLAKISVRGDGNLRHLSIGFFSSFFFSFLGHYFGFSSYYADECAKTAMASRLSGSPCRKFKKKESVGYKSHFNTDWVKEWPALIAKSHKGDGTRVRFVAFVVATFFG